MGAGSPGDWLSVAQTRNFIERLVPRPGHKLYSSTGDPIMEFVEDHSPGLHDTPYPPCDDAYYVSEGLPGHPNCCSVDTTSPTTSCARRCGWMFTAEPAPAVPKWSSLVDRERVRAWDWEGDGGVVVCCVDVKCAGNSTKEKVLTVARPRC
jgi:hypothetical protein